MELESNTREARGHRWEENVVHNEEEGTLEIIRAIEISAEMLDRIEVESGIGDLRIVQVPGQKTVKISLSSKTRVEEGEFDSAEASNKIANAISQQKRTVQMVNRDLKVAVKAPEVDLTIGNIRFKTNQIGRIIQVKGEGQTIVTNGKNIKIDGKELEPPKPEVETIMTVEMPQGKELKGKTLSGNISAEGLQGEIKLATMSGDIYTTFAEPEPNLKAETMTGNITNYLTGKSPKIEVTGSELRLNKDSIKSKIKLETMSGDITLAK